MSAASEAAKAYERITGRAVTPSPQPDVWVMIWSNRRGDTLTGYATAEAAYGARAELARENWDEITGNDGVPDTPDGLTDAAATEIYFRHIGDETAEIYPLTIVRAEVPEDTTLADEWTRYGEPLPGTPDPDPVVCPTCRSADWDFLVNDDAVCRNGHRWTVPVEDDGA